MTEKGECERCGADTTRTTITGEYQCAECARAISKQRKQETRSVDQQGLDAF